MNNYKKLNNIMGWGAFIIAFIVYFLTIEPTASLWDCSEFIAAAFKMQVPHPPGAPLFLMISHVFSLFAKDIYHVAAAINTQSATCSALTIMFLYWSITRLARKLATGDSNGLLEGWKRWAVIGSGLVGALAYTFTDSFWFSAVEGEVYAMSSLCTAVVFWGILKWEGGINEKHNLRWLVFVSFIIGLSIGVHLLSLLVIPAMVFVVYFKKYKTTRKGFIYTSILALGILVFVQYGIIQYFIKIGGNIDKFFVNSFGMPYNSGLVFYVIVVMGLLIWGIMRTYKSKNIVWNTVLTCITVIVFGYSSFATVMIRSSANPSLDENNPENAYSLLSYLDRSQYGTVPLLYGQYFNSPLDPSNPYKDGKPIYEASKKEVKYVIVDQNKNSIPNYDPKFSTFFPRMYSAQQSHIRMYKAWTNFKGTPKRFTNAQGKTEIINKPTFGENLEYFARYQIGWMFWRYFMWNYVGRQNDIQGNGPGDITKGNWISGIPFIDSMFLGPQDKVSQSELNNHGRNTYFFLPFILGLIGLFFQFNKDKKDGFVVFLFFFFTGLAITLYLNQYPLQPRERHYAFVGCFYAFAIWIGLGVFGIAEWLTKKVKAKSAITIVTIIVCLLAVPVLMADQNWDDHDRSDRYGTRDFAHDYLASCAPNAILFTNGDNDTFPLWYIQEVEGFRTDVKVVNLSLLSTDWYIDQMRRKYYDGIPVPFDLPRDKYVNGTNNFIPLVSRTKKHVDVDKIMEFIENKDSRAKLRLSSQKMVDYIPTKNFSVHVDKNSIMSNPKWYKNGYLKKSDSSKIVNELKWSIKKEYILKSELMILNLLSANDWKRPIYFAITTGTDAYMGLQKYFQLEGLTYRLIPINTSESSDQIGRVNTEVMYNNLMNKFKYGGFDKPNVYANQDYRRMIMNFRSNFMRLANALIEKGENEKAKKVLDKSIEKFPNSNVPYDFYSLGIASAYYKIGEEKKADAIVSIVTSIFGGKIDYYSSLENTTYANKVSSDNQRATTVMNQALMLVNKFHKKDDDFAKEINKKYGYIQEMLQQQRRQQMMQQQRGQQRPPQ